MDVMNGARAREILEHWVWWECVWVDPSIDPQVLPSCLLTPLLAQN